MRKEQGVKQLTVRGFDDELSVVLRRFAQREGISLNQAALKLLRRGAGLSDGRERVDTVGQSLDDLIGTWTTAEADEMDSALAEFGMVDESVWE